MSGFLNYARVLKIYTRIELKKLIEDFDALVIQRAPLVVHRVDVRRKKDSLQKKFSFLRGTLIGIKLLIQMRALSFYG